MWKTTDQDISLFILYQWRVDPMLIDYDGCVEYKYVTMLEMKASNILATDFHVARKFMKLKVAYGVFVSL